VNWRLGDRAITDSVFGQVRLAITVSGRPAHSLEGEFRNHFPLNSSHGHFANVVQPLFEFSLTGSIRAERPT
jgi:hypothetical protein